jgi:predicted nucleic acid-binding protein
MILVDSSVWIDFFRDIPTPQVEWLDRNLEAQTILVGDLILAEVLRGFTDDRGFNEAQHLMGRLQMLALGGAVIAVKSAQNFRKLRSLGRTIRGTVDVIIATRCIADELTLLHSDKDFEPFEAHLGLQVVKGFDRLNEPTH